jgi:sugar phosphate isomerase/epimerase
MDVNKIGVALWTLGPTPDEAALRRSLETAAEVGVKGVQPWAVGEDCVLDPDLCPKGKRPEMRRLIESYGLQISGFCAQLAGPTRFGGLDEEDGIEGRVGKTKRCLELAAEMGAPVVTTHPGEIPADEGDPRYATLLRAISEIAAHGERVGGIFCIETGQESAEVLKAFMERVGSPGLRVNYDPANLLRHGAVEGVKTLAPWIVHTHAKDRNPETRRETLGEGEVPWDAYLRALDATGYDGWLAIEDETRGDKVGSLKQGYAFLREKLAAL